jgi:hypothetical protein
MGKSRGLLGVLEVVSLVGLRACPPGWSGSEGGLGGQVALSQVLALQQEKDGQGEELGQAGVSQVSHA